MSNKSTSPRSPRNSSSDHNATTSTTRSHPYADKRHRSTTNVTKGTARLLVPAAPHMWAIPQLEEQIAKTAIRNAQSLLVHLQSSKTYAAAHAIQRLCELHHMFDTPAEEQLPGNAGSTYELQDEYYRRCAHAMESLATKVQVVKNTLSHFDDYWQRRVDFPPNLDLDTHHHIHRPYTADQSKIIITKTELAQHETAQARQDEQLSPDKDEAQSCSPSPSPSRPVQRSNCTNHEDLDIITPHRPEDCPKIATRKGKEVVRHYL